MRFSILFEKAHKIPHRYHRLAFPIGELASNHVISEVLTFDLSVLTGSKVIIVISLIEDLVMVATWQILVVKMMGLEVVLGQLSSLFNLRDVCEAFVTSWLQEVVLANALGS